MMVAFFRDIFNCSEKYATITSSMEIVDVTAAKHSSTKNKNAQMSPPVIF